MSYLFKRLFIYEAFSATDGGKRVSVWLEARAGVGGGGHVVSVFTSIYQSCTGVSRDGQQSFHADL